ncbi:MAG: hypothetical protein KAS66_00130 [Candidatus Omnitrophica bacterium]|nr:hypothetical protein [Candidatus Omnitrophota bacterium]
MKQKFIEWSPKEKTRDLIDQADDIISEYDTAGYILTVRQLYYQFVARGIIANSERSYKNLGRIITKARMSGMLSWSSIEDRNRQHHGYWYDEDELSPIKDLPDYIRFDRWARQEYYIEVWVEKEALGNVVSRACKPFLIPHMACKGYLSASEAWRSGRRFRNKIVGGKRCILIHLGDHDPSGIDMTRDNIDRLNIFTGFPEEVEVIRLALNMDQVEEYQPPPNPTKISDSRAQEYIKRFGYTSWELDALDPAILESKIKREVNKYINKEVWDAVVVEEREMKDMLSRVYQEWDEIRPLVE